MNEKTKDHGLTIKRATEEVFNRDDNVYNRKTIEKILKMYAEECLETLVNGGKVNLKGVGSIRPYVANYKHCGLPSMKDKEDSSYTAIKIRVLTSDILKERIKDKLIQNKEKGIDGLEEEE